MYVHLQRAGVNPRRWNGGMRLSTSSETDRDLEREHDLELDPHLDLDLTL